VDQDLSTTVGERVAAFLEVQVGLGARRKYGIMVASGRGFGFSAG